MEGSPYNPEHNLTDDESRHEKMSSTVSPERIGHVLIDSEGKHKSESLNVDSLSRTELLRVGDEVMIDGSTLRQIYESHLIGERGLRRLVAEHLRGGNMEKILQSEVMEREIDFERDPAMRHAATHTPSTSQSGTTPTLDNLLQKADASIGGQSEQISFLKARADYQAKQQAGEKNSRRMIDFAMVGTILILTTLVAILVITRK